MTFTKRQVQAWNAIHTVPLMPGEPHVMTLAKLDLFRWAVDAMELATVKDMRRTGWTWAEVGDAFGVTHQAARQRWRARGVD